MTYNLNYTTRKSIERDSNGLFICPFCFEAFRGLVYHTRQAHNINARQLRLMFNLPFNYSLQVEDLKQRRSEQALLWNMDKNLAIWGKNSRFNQGFKQSPKLTKAIARGHILKNRNKLGQGILI